MISLPTPSACSHYFRVRCRWKEEGGEEEKEGGKKGREGGGGRGPPTHGSGRVGPGCVKNKMHADWAGGERGFGPVEFFFVLQARRLRRRKSVCFVLASRLFPFFSQVYIPGVYFWSPFVFCCYPCGSLPFFANTEYIAKCFYLFLVSCRCFFRPPPSSSARSACRVKCAVPLFPTIYVVVTQCCSLAESRPKAGRWGRKGSSVAASSFKRLYCIEMCVSVMWWQECERERCWGLHLRASDSLGRGGKRTRMGRKRGLLLYLYLLLHARLATLPDEQCSGEWVPQQLK